MTKDIFSLKRCTFYKQFYPFEGSNRLILDILTKEGYTNTEVLNEVRKHPYGSDEYKRLKKQLSCATFSSIQRDLRNRGEDNHLAHTGFIQFDIDAKENQILLQPGGMEEIKQLLIDRVPYIAYMGASVSRLGLWGLIPIAYPDKHPAHFAALQQVFGSLGLSLDAAPQNVASLRFISYDPDAHIELEPVVFDDYMLPDLEAPVNGAQGIHRVARVVTEDDPIFTAACRWIEAKHNIKFQPGSIHNYIVYLCACLISAGVKKADAEEWIYKNLIPKEQVTTNCISHTYAKYH